MPLLTAYDDFVIRSLVSIRSCWQRLVFVAGLKEPGEKYTHWGLACLHGESAAEHAIARAHVEVFLDVLDTPISVLCGEFEDVKGERISAEALSPADVQGGAREHLEYVLQSLRALKRASVPSSRRAA